jgi:hypothetical protein
MKINGGHMNSLSRTRQRGAVIVTTALFLLFLLGFMGIALDFGRLFIVKTEVQTAMDSCALAAAQELTGVSDALLRATSAGRTAGNSNSVNFQGEPISIAEADVTFSATLSGTFSRPPVADAKYAKCTHITSGTAPWLLQAMGAFTGNASLGANRSVFAEAVATIVPAQTNCLLPVGVCQKSGGASFQPGEWILGTSDDTEDVKGNFRWLDLNGQGGGTNEVKQTMIGQGRCGLPGTDTLVKAGNSNGAISAWNTRFGIYHGGYSLSTVSPDLTGYSWYYDDGLTSPATLAAPSNLWGRYADLSANGYRAHSSSPTASQRPYQSIAALDIKGNGITGQDHIDKGASRRIAAVPIVDCAAIDTKAPVKISGIACILMLHPVEKKTGNWDPKKPMNNRGLIWIEYINDATATTNNACPTTGLPGGLTGVKVPTLVQ